MTARKRNEQLIEENNRLEKQIREAMKRNKKLKEEADSLKKEIEKLNADAEGIREKIIDEAKRETSRYLIRKNEIRKEISEMERKLAEMPKWHEVEYAYEREREFQRIKKDQDEIALYLRGHYGSEIGAGEHAGLSLAQCVIRYLERERRFHKASLMGRLILALRGWL